MSPRKSETKSSNPDENEPVQQAGAPEINAQALIARADRMLGDLDAAYHIGISKVERKNSKAFNAAFTTMYMAIVAIEERGETDDFVASRGIRAHGNTRNPYFNLVRAFAASTSTVLQGQLCKKAQLIELARLHDVKPSEFDHWKKLWPIEMACEELRRRKNRPNREKKESSEPKVVTRGLTGEHPALLRFSPDGSGKFKLAQILSDADLLAYTQALEHKTSETTQNS